jgi:uracil-DNA glycosylase family 4
MDRLAEEVSNCRRCDLCELRENVVFGEGDLETAVVLVGEAPGRREDEEGRPFVGSAGKLLNRILDEIGLNRGDIYITNIVKCRPPGNRRPNQGEVEECATHLDKQLSLIEPRVIVPMGNSATGYFLKRHGLRRHTIGSIHGHVLPIKAAWGDAKLYPIYHPAAILYNRRLEEDLRSDLRALRKLIDPGLSSH